MAARWCVLMVAAFLVTSCSRKTETAPTQAETEEKENEQQPREDKIAEDCVAFVRATKVAAAADCPGCSGEGAEVLAFRGMKMEQISCSADRCQVSVTVRAVFNQGPAGTITGGLTGWIPAEQRLEYANGRAPEGEQMYRVKIIYQRTAEAWRAIEFDRDDAR